MGKYWWRSQPISIIHRSVQRALGNRWWWCLRGDKDVAIFGDPRQRTVVRRRREVSLVHVGMVDGSRPH